MRTSFAVAAVALASIVSAIPVPGAQLVKRKADIDGIILNYALTLEHLEAAFYKGGLEKYSASDFESAGYPEWVRYRLTEIASHEKTHVTFLTGALKAAKITPTAACEYSFPDTSPATFLAVAQILEGVGTSAYLGAAASITEGAYLTAAGSILTVEARHASWIASSANLDDGFPNAFDSPLTFNEVYSLAAGFITSCPKSNPDLGVKAFPALTLAKADSGITLTFKNAKAGYAVFINGGAQYVEKYTPGTAVTVPDAVMGQAYIVITSKNATVTDDLVLAGPAVLDVPVPATTFPF